MYTTIPNRPNLNSVAGKYEVGSWSEGYVFTKIKNNGVVNAHQEPIEPIDRLRLSWVKDGHIPQELKKCCDRKRMPFIRATLLKKLSGDFKGAFLVVIKFVA